MTALLILGSIALVAVNAFFVIAEYALVRARPAKLQAEADDDVRGASGALGLLDDINEYISTCQVGVTMASIGLGAIGAEKTAKLIERALKGTLGHALSVVIGVIVGYLLLTSVQVILGELVPKIYTITHAEPLLRRIVRPLRFTRALLSPLSRTYSAAAAVI